MKEQGWTRSPCKQNLFLRYICFVLRIKNWNTRLWGINPVNSLGIPQSLVLRSILFENWSIINSFVEGTTLFINCASHVCLYGGMLAGFATKVFWTGRHDHKRQKTWPANVFEAWGTETKISHTLTPSSFINLVPRVLQKVSFSMTSQLRSE